MAAPIYNPIIPCVHGIPGGMFPGRMLRFQGTVPPNADRFAINLQCGPNTDPRDDIALHLNFRFVEMCVVRNNLANLNWGPEETSGGMPLVRGQPFEALVLCEPGSIKVALNGVHFCEFGHRTPPQRITHITVDGDVQLQFIGFEGPQYMGGADAGFAAPGYGAPPPAYAQPGYGQPPQGFVPRPPMHNYPPQGQYLPPQGQYAPPTSVGMGGGGGRRGGAMGKVGGGIGKVGAGLAGAGLGTVAGGAGGFLAGRMTGNRSTDNTTGSQTGTASSAQDIATDPSESQTMDVNYSRSTQDGFDDSEDYDDGGYDDGGYDDGGYDDGGYDDGGYDDGGYDDGGYDDGGYDDGGYDDGGGSD